MDEPAGISIFSHGTMTSTKIPVRVGWQEAWRLLMAEVMTTDGERINVKLRTLVGRRCRTTRELSNRIATFPAGTEMEIRGAWRSGFNLTSIPCKHCGISGHISQVHRKYVQLIPEEKGDY